MSVLQRGQVGAENAGARMLTLASPALSGVVASTLYLITLYLESRARENSFWFWRFIYRPSGRYLVGK